MWLQQTDVLSFKRCTTNPRILRKSTHFMLHSSARFHAPLLILMNQPCVMTRTHRCHTHITTRSSAHRILIFAKSIQISFHRSITSDVCASWKSVPRGGYAERMALQLRSLAGHRHQRHGKKKKSVEEDHRVVVCFHDVRIMSHSRLFYHSPKSRTPTGSRAGDCPDGRRW